MLIGVPKEIKNHEYRVALRPQDVKELCDHSIGVIVQSEAGFGSSFSNQDYQAAGAKIVKSAEELFAEAPCNSECFPV